MKNWALSRDLRDRWGFSTLPHGTPGGATLTIKGVSAPFRSYVLVSREQIARNFRNVCSVVGPHVEVAGVGKADAYGHGALEGARGLVGEACPVPFEDRFRHGPTGYAGERDGDPGDTRRYAVRAPGRTDDPLRLRGGLHFGPNRDATGLL